MSYWEEKYEEELYQLREQNRVLREALQMIEAIICDKKLCGHFTAEEIRAQVKAALTATSQPQ